MSQILDTYLDRVLAYANLSPPRASEVRSELRDHLLKKVDDLEAGGLTHEEPMYKAVQVHGHPRLVGYGLREGFPWVDVRTQGTARGILAIGPRAVGVVAIGGAACGVVAVGGMAAGVIAMGGLSVALVFAFCGLGIGTVAYGGCVAGVVAVGGFAAGLVAVGGYAVGLLAKGGVALSAYTSAKPAPELLKGLARTANLVLGRSGWLSLLLMTFMLALLALSGVMRSLEQRRIQAADPWLQE
jgi:hypothetical protein